MDIVKTLKRKLQGKKTYVVAAGVLAVGILQAFGVPIPAIAWPILSALGLGSLRAGVDKAGDGLAENFLNSPVPGAGNDK